MFLGDKVITSLFFFFSLFQCIVHHFRSKFYQVFYGAFDDQFAAMDAILNGKESFALQVTNVLFFFNGTKVTYVL